jgi:hypothetical protein
MTDPADIFSRTRALIIELSSAGLGIECYGRGLVRARMEKNIRAMEGNCIELGRLLSQALQMQMILLDQIKKEPRADVVDMRGVNIGGRGWGWVTYDD